MPLQKKKKKKIDENTGNQIISSLRVCKTTRKRAEIQYLKRGF